MFGLTRREQRWKADQAAAEVLAGLAGIAIRATAEVRIAEAKTDAEMLRSQAAEIARLQDLLKDALANVNEITDAKNAEIERLRTAAQAVVDRWDTPPWKDAPATAIYINTLRNALEAK